MGTVNPTQRVEQTSPGVCTIRLDLSSGDVSDFLIISDVHIDSRFCNRKALGHYLDRAVERKAAILVIGDLFDAMQGPRDPRAAPADLDAKHLSPAYFNAIVGDAAEFLLPYARHLVLLAKGNHEMAVIKHYGISLLDMLARDLRRAVPDSPAVVGGYEGWVRIMIKIYTMCTQLRWYYHHGAGGGAIMSFGTLNVRRKASYIPDCDAFLTGHTHDQYVLPMARLRLSNQGVQYQDVMWAVRAPGFKDERHPDSWAVQKDHPPKPIGAVWGTITAEAKRVRVQFAPDVF